MSRSTDYDVLRVMGVRVREVRDLAEGSILFTRRMMLLVDRDLTKKERRRVTDRCIMLIALGVDDAQPGTGASDTAPEPALPDESSAGVTSEDGDDR